MSSISFPPSDHDSSGSTSSAHASQFYAPSFDSNSSFHMNPLSSHPPRTPRTSVISSAHTYGASIYEGNDDAKEQTPANEDEPEEEEDKGEDRAHRIRKEEVWREIVATSNGRDKAFKLMQYSIRVYLLFHSSLTTSRLVKGSTRPPWEVSLVKRLHSAMSSLSLSRKLLLLFNWLTPLTTVMAQQSVPYSSEQSTEVSKKTLKPFLHTILYAPPPVLLDLVHTVADDVATFSKLGLIGRRTGERAAHFSDWCWLLATLVGLVENGVERQMIGSLQHDVESRLYTESMTGATAKSKPATSKIDEKELTRLQRQDRWLQITRAKLVMDLIFVSYEVFTVKRGREPVMALTGLASAVLSSARLYDRHRGALAKASTF